MTDFDVAIIGCGNMGGAMMSGYLGREPASRILVVDPDMERARTLLPACDGLTFSLVLAPLVTRSARLTVIAVKPQSFPALLPELARTTAAEGLILSIAAGVAADKLGQSLPGARIVRCMPNTPAMVGAGTSVLWGSSDVSAEERHLCETLCRSVGTAEWVDDERLIDAATAVSGSGPAYVFAFAEALARAAEAVGLAPDLAARLALGTLTGAARMLDRNAAAPAALKAAVRSPAGTTDAALRIFEERDALDLLVRRAVEAAHERAKQLRALVS